MRVEIVDSDPLWPKKFQAQASVIAEALGDAALMIEHIGSTSVPGLAAKPIIDILLVIEDSADEESYFSQMEAAGYELHAREPAFHEHRMFRTLARDVHVHVYSPSSPEIERFLMFRDRLRKNTEDRQFYEQTKRELATQTWVNGKTYAKAKTQVIDSIIASARADAAAK